MECQFDQPSVGVKATWAEMAKQCIIYVSDPRRKYHVKILAVSPAGDGYQTDQTISTPGCVCKYIYLLFVSKVLQFKIEFKPLTKICIFFTLFSG